MYNLLIRVLNLVIRGLVDGGNAIFSILPNSPFLNVNNAIDLDLLAYVNWVIPLDLIITTLGVWLVAVGGYYLYSTVLRWIRAI